MGRHVPREFDAAKFSEEVLGTAREQQINWYEREIAWRRRLMEVYSREMGILIQQYDLLVEQTKNPPEDTGPNPIIDQASAPGGDPIRIGVPETYPGDPEVTQAMELPERDDA